MRFIIEGRELRLKTSLTPEGSMLRMMKKYKSIMISTRIIENIKADTFAACARFVETGRIDGEYSDEALVDIIKGLDMLGCLAFDYHLYFKLEDVPIEFMKILQEEEWYRTHFSTIPTDRTNAKPITTDEYRSMKLMYTSHMRYISKVDHAPSSEPKRVPEGYMRYPQYHPDELGSIVMPDGTYLNADRLIPEPIPRLNAIFLLSDRGAIVYTENDLDYTEYVKVVGKADDLKTMYLKEKTSRNKAFDMPLIQCTITPVKSVLCNGKGRNPLDIPTLNQIINGLQTMMPPKFDWSNVLMAGGAVVNALSGSRSKLNDIDLFIYGLDRDAADTKLVEIVRHFGPSDWTVYRTKNSISFRSQLGIGPSVEVMEIQIILRLYSSPSEILTGFDIDSCCVGFNGTEILATPRAMYSLKHMVNVVNLARMSPTYNYRMAKYMHRGFDVLVPGFDKNYVTSNTDLHIYQTYRQCMNRPDYRRHTIAPMLRKMSGLSYLISMSQLHMYHEFKLISDYEDAVRNTYLVGHSNISSEPFNTDGKIYKPTCIQYRRDSIINIHSFTISSSEYDSAKFGISQSLEWKVQNPGEQLTNTFNRTIIKDPSTWYNGIFYQIYDPVPPSQEKTLADAWRSAATDNDDVSDDYDSYEMYDYEDDSDDGMDHNSDGDPYELLLAMTNTTIH